MVVIFFFLRNNYFYYFNHQNAILKVLKLKEISQHATMILLVAYCYHYLIHLFSLVGKGERKEVLKVKFFNIFNVNTLTKFIKKKKKKKLVCPKGTNNRFFFFF